MIVHFMIPLIKCNLVWQQNLTTANSISGYLNRQGNLTASDGWFGRYKY